jgi:hypothetical protein
VRVEALGFESPLVLLLVPAEGLELALLLVAAPGASILLLLLKKLFKIKLFPMVI